MLRGLPISVDEARCGWIVYEGVALDLYLFELDISSTYSQVGYQ